MSESYGIVTVIGILIVVVPYGLYLGVRALWRLSGQGSK